MLDPETKATAALQRRAESIANMVLDFVVNPTSADIIKAFAKAYDKGFFDGLHDAGDIAKDAISQVVLATAPAASERPS